MIRHITTSISGVTLISPKERRRWRRLMRMASPSGHGARGLGRAGVRWRRALAGVIDAGGHAALLGGFGEHLDDVSGECHGASAVLVHGVAVEAEGEERGDREEEA